MRELHLFAGIGGGILGGMLLGHRCVGAVEIDPYCRRVLEARQRDGILESFPIHDDIRTFDGTAWRGRIDVVCGGFPCQPWSVAGKRLGTADPRHLWPEMARVIAECRPRFVFAENVSLAAFAEPWRDLRGLGYRVPPAICISASDVGAPHIRKRWWLLAADTNSEQHQGRPHAQRGETGADLPADANSPRLHEQHNEQRVARTKGAATRARDDGGEEHVADAESIGRREGRPEPTREQRGPGAAIGGSPVADADRTRLEERRTQSRDGRQECTPAVGSRLGNTDGVRELRPQGRQPEEWRRVGDAGWWATEPDVGRVAHGVHARVDRLRALGNAQVPLQAATAFAELMARLGDRAENAPAGPLFDEVGVGAASGRANATLADAMHKAGLL